MIDLHSVTVRGSDPACLSFPATARLESVRFDGRTMAIRSVGGETWPAVAIDDTGDPVQAATLWVFLRIAGRWYATGAERLRPNQVNGEKPEGPISDLIGDGWLYDAGRWQEMAHHNPQPGDPVGFMLVAGSTRSDNQTPVRARSNVDRGPLGIR